MPTVYTEPWKKRIILVPEYLEDNNYLYDMFFKSMSLNSECLENMAKSFKTLVTKSTLEHLISEIPKEGLPCQANIDALIEYLLYLVEHIGDICETIKQHTQS